MFESTEIKDVKRTIGQLVRSIRKSRKISQVALAESLNVSRTTIQNLELGNNITIDTLLKVLKEVDMLDTLNGVLVEVSDRQKTTRSLY